MSDSYSGRVQARQIWDMLNSKSSAVSTPKDVERNFMEHGISFSRVKQTRRGLKPRGTAIMNSLNEVLEHNEIPLDYKHAFEQFVWLLSGAITPVLLYLIPLESPYNSSGGGIGWWLTIFVNMWISGAAVVLWVMCSGGKEIYELLGFKSSRLLGIPFSVTMTVISAIGLLVGIYPVPFLLLLGGGIACFNTSAMMYLKIPKAKRTWSIQKEFLRGNLVLFLGFGLIGYLAVARTVFQTLDATQQSYFCPFFFLGKVVVKTICKIIVFNGTNPSFEPIIAFWIDFLSAIFTNLLFLDLVSSDTFLIMIGLDVTENVFHACKGAWMLRKAVVRVADHTDEDEVEAYTKERRKAFNYILCFGFSEVAEICSSFVSISMITVFNLGPNRSFSTLLGPSALVCRPDGAIRTALTYSCIDCVIEIVLFFLLCRCIQYNFDIPIVKMLMVLIDYYKKYFWFGVGVASNVTLQIFLLHGGCDTRFEFGWLADDFDGKLNDICNVTNTTHN